MEKTTEFQKNISFCFTDYAKAFDCVEHTLFRGHLLPSLFLVANLKILHIWFPGPQKITEREARHAQRNTEVGDMQLVSLRLRFMCALT